VLNNARLAAAVAGEYEALSASKPA